MSRRGLGAVLGRVARAYQDDEVIPRCASCRAPCCRLQTLVLELDWRRLKGLWDVGRARAEFDRALARGEGPGEIRADRGLYYAHGRTCPGYDEASGLCRVYGGALQPLGCRTFPVYEEDGRLVADLRCEAVDLDALESRLRPFLRPGERLCREADRDFSFLVTLSVRSSRIRTSLRRAGARRS